MPNVNDDRVRSRRLRRHEIQGAQFDAERGGHALYRSIASMDMQYNTAAWPRCHDDLASKEWLGRFGWHWFVLNSCRPRLPGINSVFRFYAAAPR